MSSYVEKALVQGEQVLYLGRISLWALFPQLFFGALLTPVVIGLFILIPAWIKYRSTELAVTNKRVIAKFGFVRRHTVEINLDKVEALRVDQTVMGRFLNYGTIHISGAGTSVAPMPNIADPLVFRRKFMEATNRPLTRGS